MKNKKTAIMVTAGIMALLCAMWLLLSDKSNDVAQGLLFGIGFGLLGVGMGDIISKNMYNKNPKLYKKIIIEQNDERNICIKTQAQAKAGKILMYLNFMLVMVMVIYKVALWAILSLVLINLVYSLCIVFFVNRFNEQG